MNPFALTHRLRFSLLLLAGFTLTTAEMEAQERKEEIRLEVTQKPLSQVFRQLEKRTDYKFVYSHDDVRGLTATRDVQAADIKTALEQLLQGLPLKYSIEGKFVYIVSERDASSPGRQVRQKRATVSGQVVDAQGNPLPGATVVVKGTTIGTATDMDGRYTLAVPEGDHTLQVSMVGMRTENVAVGRRTHINVSLAENVEMMDEVVVTGYQTISKERATGAYAIIDSEMLETKPTANLAEALNGMVPGLAIQSAPADGGTTRFIIRGQGTLQDNQSDRDPLIVVDGFPISGYTGTNDPFSTINPNDVESVTVLKDAAATSIYGARAANGVIVITTKKGSQTGNKLDISADAYWSISQRADLDYLFNMASAEDQFRFVEMMHSYDPINLSGTSDPYSSPTAERGYLSAPYALLFERDVKGHITNDQYNTYKQQLIDMANQGLWKRDLNKYIFQRMVHQQYNVAIRGTNERMDYAFSASFDDEKGYQRGNGNRRVMLNLSSNIRLTDHLSFDLAVNTTFNKEENNGTDPAVIKTWLSPWTRLADDEGNFVHVPTGSTIYQPIYESKYAGKVPADWTYNPVLDRRYTGNDADALNLRVQGGFTYKTDWGLTLSAKGQYERRDYDSHSSWDPESFTVRDYYNTYSTLNSATGMYSSYFPQGGIFTDSGNKYEAYNLRGQADYNRTFGKHAVSALVGTEIISATTDANPSITRYGYNSYTNSVLTAPDYVGYYTDIFGVRGHLPFDELGTLSTLEDRFFSVYANASYTYDDRYSATVSFRTDASNFQAEDVRKKFSPFWSVGGSWLISREDFMADVSWVDQLKLRASYGIAGVAAGRSGTSSVTTVEVWPGSVDFTGNEAFNTIAQRGNPSLTWEKSRTVNIGVDFGLFGNKLFGSVDFYNKYSYDVLSKATVSAISQGVTSATFNNAEVLNRGVEFSVGTNLRIVDDLRWSSTLNYAFNHNEVTKFNLTSQYPAVFNHGFVEGYPVDFYAVLKPVGYTPEGFVLLQGKDGTQEALTDMDSSHAYEQVYRNEGETLDDNNWAYYLGAYTPKSNLSFTNTFTWRGLTLSFMITGRFGYYVERSDYFDYDSNSPYFSKQLENSFRVYDEGYANQKGYSAFPLYTDDSFPVYQATGGYMDAYNAQLVFDRAYIKGDHIRLNEVYLGYDLPSKWLDKQKVFNRVNVYFKANNLGCIWKANGEMDPDYTLGSLKPMPTFMLGLKVNFKSK